MSGTVTYKGATLTTISDGGTKVLKTAGKFMEDDVTVSILGRYTATLSTSTPNSACRIVYNNVSYYQNGENFIYNGGESVRIVCTGSRADASIYINDVRVAYELGGSTAYDWTLPSANISVSLTYGAQGEVRITYTESSSGGGSGNIWQDEDGYIHLDDEGGETPTPTPTPSSASKKQINFIDYDGTIVNSYTSTQFSSLSALPANPSHTGLVAQGWNWTLAEIQSYLTNYPNADVNVGQMYTTESGDTEIDVSFVDAARLSPYLGCAVNGTITIDWGDNTTSTVTGTSLTTQIRTLHNYTTVGNYTITIHVVSGSLSFYGTNTYPLLSKQSSTINTNNYVYTNCVKNIRIGENVHIGSYAFSNCPSLTIITIPSTVTSIGNSAFRHCYSLTSITIPSAVTSIGNNAFQNCYSLTSITIPSAATSIGTYVFQACYSLTSITILSTVTSIETYVFQGCSSLASVIIPSTVTSIGAFVFANCPSLASVTIPSAVTSIGNSVFANCYGVAQYHITSTTPPTLGTNVFQSIQSDCIIYVPASAVETYKAATNWSTYADYIQGE